jgi:hypothetical protein
MILGSRSIAVLTAVVALSGVAGASAATSTHTTIGKTSHAKVVKKVAAKRKTSTTTTGPVIKTTGATTAAMEAFPTGGKGSGTEAVCRAFTSLLNADQEAQENATDKQDVIDATNQLNSDYNDALSSGCAVID